MTDAINGHPNGTPGPWSVVDYDCGDAPHYDHNGSCPSIQAPDNEDCAIVHWDGFKQKYWSACNGNQRQIETNARAIAEVPAMVVALRAIAYLEPRTHVQDHWFSEARAILARIDGGAA